MGEINGPEKQLCYHHPHTMVLDLYVFVRRSIWCDNQARNSDGNPYKSILHNCVNKPVGCRLHWNHLILIQDRITNKHLKHNSIPEMNIVQEKYVA